MLLFSPSIQLPGVAPFAHLSVVLLNSCSFLSCGPVDFLALDAWCFLQVRALFERYGCVQEVFLLRNNTGGSRSRKGPSGSAFVRFAYKEQALYAIANLGGKHVLPSKLQLHDLLKRCSFAVMPLCVAERS